MLLGCSKTTVDNSVINDLDLNRYLGKWYEIARFDHFFERDMQYTTALYTLREDGKIEILNKGIKNGKSKESKGITKKTKEKALLRVSFFRPFYADYRILFLDEDYNYALIGSNSNNHLWLLSRSPILPDDAIKELISEAKQRGYKTEKLLWVKQESYKE